VNVALFPSPIQVSVDAGFGCETGNGMLIGIETGSGLMGLVMNEIGLIFRIPVGNFTINWRYDPATGGWTWMACGRVHPTNTPTRCSGWGSQGCRLRGTTAQGLQVADPRLSWLTSG
jgi:hypothetical protein